MRIEKEDLEEFKRHCKEELGLTFENDGEAEQEAQQLIRLVKLISRKPGEKDF
jgi:hypothetical protein